MNDEGWKKKRRKKRERNKMGREKRAKNEGGRKKMQRKGLNKGGINANGKVKEDSNRSNIKITHPFFTELVDKEDIANYRPIAVVNVLAKGTVKGVRSE